MSRGECTITLEDVAYQLGLPIDGEPVTGCLYEFETWMPDGRERPRWDWFKEVFGVIPPPGAADACIVTFSWLTATFGVVLEHASEIQVCRHAQAYIMLLLSRQLFGDKTLLEFLLDGSLSWTRLMTLGNTVGVLPLWRGCTGTFVVLQTGSWSTLQAHYCSYRVGYSGGFLVSDLMISISSAGPKNLGNLLLWTRYLPISDERDPRVLLYRTQLDRMIHRDVDHVIPQFGGVQNSPHHPVNIDWLHARDGKEGDMWFPSVYQTWHGLWDSRHDHTFTVEEVQDPGPSADYLRWWFLAWKRYLAPVDAFFPRPLDEIPSEAFDRVADTPHTYRVDDAPDNRRPDRRRMVGTRTTARDWQWVDEMLGENIHVPRQARRMPEGGSRREGRGGGRGGQAGGRGPSDQAHGGASSSRAPAGQAHGGASNSQDYQDFLVGLNSPGFQRTLQQIFTGDTVYRPYVDGCQGQIQVDLNEPASHPSHMFMTYAGTPPSTYMPEPYVVASEIVPAPAADDPHPPPPPHMTEMVTRAVHPTVPLPPPTSPTPYSLPTDPWPVLCLKQTKPVVEINLTLGIRSIHEQLLCLNRFELQCKIRRNMSRTKRTISGRGKPSTRRVLQGGLDAVVPIAQDNYPGLWGDMLPQMSEKKLL
ncbi:hypothetical protein PIB30_070752 [Stylosanthes scabra]|uniref:Aminotransferase-like plant mobile domain-containing protein n=1 Tax=Stylosanthes scabra TaxID=79078 RepID=A0ABU6TNA2_9FABA|nr:hypothetical protein [Stylosanthes scabra]